MEYTQVYHLKELYEAVQLGTVFTDGKTFADSTPLLPLTTIHEKYQSQKKMPGFLLHDFVHTCFEIPATTSPVFKSDTTKPVDEHLAELWQHLTRQPVLPQGSLIALPFPYIVPGGRFREIYYWDSYFTMLGLLEHGHIEMVENMVCNFAHLIITYGHIPNGNRSYYLSRSQPPFFALMVALLANAKNSDAVYVHYIDALEKEYAYWQNGISADATAFEHIVKLTDGAILNRYYDTNPAPRQESYAEDIHISKKSSQPESELFINIRAGAESGWDFSSRWFADQKSIGSIQTVNIIPVDLNCLLYKLETVLIKGYLVNNDTEKANTLKVAAQKRLQAIYKYCWSDELEFFTDYNWIKKAQVLQITAAALVPLFILDEPQDFIVTRIEKIKKTIQNKLLKPGGIVTTTINTGEQWDAPNGWAPLQWMAVKGLVNYGENSLAADIANRWLTLNERVFKATGKMMEKYNVEDITKLAGGGEYESQDGFGWTNGVYIALQKLLKNI